MKVKVLISMAGAGFAYAPGDLVDMDEDEAARMIKAGRVEAVGDRKENAKRKVSREQR